jgi:phosphoenolpyruvate synthase/pyruvate phosphate dikinase
MVYGNLNIRSGTGIALSRNPITGDKMIFGEFLCKAEGHDVLHASSVLPIEVIDLLHMHEYSD